MLVISHRGNTNGVDSLENCPAKINFLLQSMREVEIDVWRDDGKIYLGHDSPQYQWSDFFLKKPGLWCHAKNLDALEHLLKNNIRCFWHEKDKFTLTSCGKIWTYPGQEIGENSIIVDLSPSWKTKNYKCFGVCVDYL